jgi:hypothetical protein
MRIVATSESFQMLLPRNIPAFGIFSRSLTLEKIRRRTTSARSPSHSEYCFAHFFPLFPAGMTEDLFRKFAHYIRFLMDRNCRSIFISLMFKENQSSILISYLSQFFCYYSHYICAIHMTFTVLSFALEFILINNSPQPNNSN